MQICLTEEKIIKVLEESDDQYLYFECFQTTALGKWEPFRTNPEQDKEFNIVSLPFKSLSQFDS